MNRRISTVSVIGLGYVGLPTAATLASRGLDVIGVDKSTAVVDRINKGLTHIVEPDLDMVVRSAVQQGRLRASCEMHPADAFMIAVPTPVKKDNSPDMRAVEAATDAIAPVLKRGNLVIIESTSPVGTTEKVAAILKRRRPDLSFPMDKPEAADVLMAYCPERVLPGRTLKELVDNARLIGGLDRASAEAAKRLYETFVRGDIVLTSARVAEMSKLAENAYRDVNVAFANELSLACDELNVDVWEVIRSANLHPRVDILSPGPGVGGHCIPIDPWFIHHAAPDATPLIRTAREVNTRKTAWVISQIKTLAERFETPKIALLGLSYKQNIDDLRESPAMQVAAALVREGWLSELNLVEPHIEELPAPLTGNNHVRLMALEEAVDRSNVVAILVPHNAFRGLTRARMADKALLDAVGMLKAA